MKVRITDDAQADLADIAARVTVEVEILRIVDGRRDYLSLLDNL